MLVFTDFINKFFSSDLLETEVFGNALGNFILAGVSLVVFLVIFKIIQWATLYRLRKLAERTSTDVDDALINIIGTIKPPFYSFLALYFAVTLFISLPGSISRFMTVVLILWVVYQVISAVQVLIDYVARRALGGEDSDEAKVAAGLIGKIAKIILWVVGLLLILSNLGVNVNSLIAGLGVGGIAIAFALQSILGDLFSSFAIYFDKPFVVGDFIVVGENSGTVERIGIKTTRIRSLQGEELVIPNQELTSARIHNYKSIKTRRVSFSFGVLYETPKEVLREIPGIIEGIVKGIDLARFDRIHFARFDDSSLTFDVVYFVDSSDYVEYMDVRQEVNFRIKEIFDERGISMAYPTRTLYMTEEKKHKTK